MPAYQKNYNIISKLLHKFALGSPLIKRAAFDIDSLVCPNLKENKFLKQPVYISGLARGGTTILLEALYSTKEFTSLTYRDMPFATAPYLWGKISKSFYKNDINIERAHDDGIKINYDSPEAFEEIFWSIFNKNKYIKKNRLEVIELEDEILDYYKKYVSNIINSSNYNKRYLAKNNNNLLRISSLKKIFPDSIIIVPFRNPVDHASSLLKLHKKFIEMHNKDPFSLKYMNWLGHFEFGKNFKPFSFNDDAIPDSKEELLNINYWLRYWNAIYNYLLKNHSKDIVFFDYNKFCEKPEKSLIKIGEIVNNKNNKLREFSRKIQTQKPYDNTGDDTNLLNIAYKTHQKLKNFTL